MANPIESRKAERRRSNHILSMEHRREYNGCYVGSFDFRWMGKFPFHEVGNSSFRAEGIFGFPQLGETTFRGLRKNPCLLHGNRIDLSFSHVDTLEDDLADSLTAVLLDKDGRIPYFPPPNESSYFITQPTQELYDGCCTGFFFALGSHIPKTIWRRKLPLLKYYIEGWLRESVTMMLGWDIGIRTGWEKSLGSKGKHLEGLLTPDVWNEYKRTYVDSDYDNLRESLFLFHSIFKKSAEFVAEKCGFRFPRETADKVLAFFEHVETLPIDSERIY